MTMGAVYDPEVIDRYKREGYMPFVCILSWKPEGRSAAISTFSKMTQPLEREGVKGVHGWGLLGRDSMIVIGWYNSPVKLQKWCTLIKFGTNICMDICPAIDNFSLATAFKELASRLPNLRIPKAGARRRKTPKAGG
jgi:hypothetical protein